MDPTLLAYGDPAIWAVDWLAGVGIAFFVLVLPILMFSNSREDFNLRDSVAEAVMSLGKLADPYAVGILARMHKRKCNVVRVTLNEVWEARQSLLSALTAVHSEHYGLLPRDATLSLCDVLSDEDEELALPTLEALGRAGTGAAVQPVRRLAEDSKSEAIRSSAATVLPILEERLRIETGAARLLRPADSPEVPAEVLLRPASSATGVPEEQLLRPSDRPES